MTGNELDVHQREHAIASTGPTTKAGKQRSKWNALTHGLLAKEVVISAGEGKENPAEFRHLLAHLRDDLAPEGAVEEMLVERIAVCYWRLRRVLQAEAGEIRRELDTVTMDDLTEQAIQARIQIDSLPSSGVTLGRKAVLRNLEASSMGLRHLIDLIDDVRRSVEDAGVLDDDDLKRLADIYGMDEHGLWSWCRLFTHMAEDCDPEAVADGLTPEKCREMIRRVLGEERTRLDALKSWTDEREALQASAKVARLALPDGRVADKILRYETTIERQLYRALNHLERVQRQRLGEVVPPPLRLEVGHAD